MERKLSKDWQTPNHQEGWLIQYQYDKSGNIIQTIKTTIRKIKTLLDIEIFT
ncbi:hypothetical protein LNQ81_13485 [Myroides sp. M-43]|uniref:hypothetical protein n=1 Tax=Myroides oncorhynchi TaxID=2893756 RepID=UPI001E4C9C09|nr:hypothetical protein [Myroides oncorhynchi]MCC9043685.1 hypothetical protein [Myroides oncorhynchi]